MNIKFVKFDFKTIQQPDKTSYRPYKCCWLQRILDPQLVTLRVDSADFSPLWVRSGSADGSMVVGGA